MTLAEKIGNLNTNAPEIKSLGLNAYNWWSESSSGVDAPTPTTKFAFPITTGMSFNRTLWKLTGRQIGHEARALMNVGKGLSTFWAPVVNLAREPRWGRNIEVPSEDPYQSGEYAEAFVTGMEQAPEDPFHIQASACCKHYAANSMEHSTECGVTHTRHDYDAIISQQDLVDSYLLPFQACVEKGRVSGLMCSYNAINGKPSCANDWLLQTAARDEWGFDGYVTSDCDADADVYNKHHYTKTAEETVAAVLNAGTDVDCTSFVGTHAKSALDQKLIDEALIDTRLKVLFKVRMRLGHFDPVGPLQSISTDDVCSTYSQELAANGPVQSAALLKNKGAALPLSPATGTIAIIGPNANLSKSDCSYYGPKTPCGGNYWTVIDSVKKYAPNANVVSIAGVPTVSSSDTSGIPAAVALAKTADVVILAVGTDLSWAHEEHDATSIAFTDAQSQLMAQVAAVAKKTVVLTYTATPLDISDILANDQVGAIMHVGQPSTTILGIGELLFGETSPAGRTVQTIYPKTYTDQISIFDFNMRPGPSVFPRPDCSGKNGTNPGRTHRFYVDKPVVPFGFGLSYTTFAYDVSSDQQGPLSLDPVRTLLAATKEAGRTFPSSETLTSAAPLVNYYVNVTNTGTMDADHVVLGFAAPPGAGVDGVPLQTLFGFERVHVKAGETVTVNIYPSLTDFTNTMLDGTKEPAVGEWTFRFGVKEAGDHGQGFHEAKLMTV
jgi:pre-mRNA-splicing factor SYF2/beta-D-xylosidase 4